MNGTEKQIKWAMSIKKTALDGHVQIPMTGLIAQIVREETKLSSSIEKLSRYTGEKRTRREQNIDTRTAEIKNLRKLVTMINNCDDAVWFIDNRNAFQNLHFEDLEAFLAKNAEK